MESSNSQHVVQGWGTTRHAQISAIVPAMKAPELTLAALGEALSRFRCKYPANGNINTAVRMIPEAGSQ
jgi:hypothetical protein